MAAFLKSPKGLHHTYPTRDMRGHAHIYTACPMSVWETRGIRKMASPSKHVLSLTEDRRQIV